MEQTIIADALDNLRVHQRQLDADGCEVGVSRQALNDAITYIGRLTADRDFWKERFQVETRARIELGHELAGAKIALEQAWESSRERDARIAALEARLAEMTRRRDEWRKKAEGYDDVRRALREKVGTPWPPHMSRLLWAGIAADEKKRADDAEAQLATLSPAPEAQEDPHEVLHVYDGDGGVIIRENGNVSTFGMQSEQVIAAFDAASDYPAAPQEAEPVAWQWRYRAIGKEIGPWNEWEEGKAPELKGSPMK